MSVMTQPDTSNGPVGVMSSDSGHPSVTTTARVSTPTLPSVSETVLLKNWYWCLCRLLLELWTLWGEHYTGLIPVHLTCHLQHKKAIDVLDPPLRKVEKTILFGFTDLF